ncbi:MAG: hypothetical protein WCQ21_11045 [Verrucomicrobiota bacterium]
MSLTQLKQAAANLPVKKQRELIAYLVARQTERDDDFKRELATKIDDRNPARWMELNDAKKRYGDQ